jgi:hypothetical protein
VRASPERTYTCSDYREEMRLLGLRRRLERDEVAEEERARLLREIEALERALSLG